LKDEASGKALGEMNCRLTFSQGGYGTEKFTKLLFELAEDGKPKSVGYARYGDKLINVSDMAQ
jgi:hypothetical protein